jgi:cell division protein FtsQ
MSWFARKRVNRKVGRGQVLDVKLRSSKLRAARARVIAIGLSSFFALVLGVGLLLWLVDRGVRVFVYENKAFTIRDIEVQTDGVLSPDQLRRWAGIKPGENLMALDLNSVRRKLELIPLVESVAIDRVPPSTLRLRIVERVPLAQINLPQPVPGGGIDFKAFQIDEKGVVMLPATPAQRASAMVPATGVLPVLAGVHPNDVQPGRRIHAPQLHAALDLIQAFERSPMAGLAEIKRIDISAPEVLIATVAQDVTVTFGLKDHEMQLARWREIYNTADSIGKSILTLDLAVSNNIPVTLSDAGPSPTPTTKPPVKTSHLRRKHV